VTVSKEQKVQIRLNKDQFNCRTTGRRYNTLLAQLDISKTILN
jgi:hypothetical protein